MKLGVTDFMDRLRRAPEPLGYAVIQVNPWVRTIFKLVDPAFALAGDNPLFVLVVPSDVEDSMRLELKAEAVDGFDGLYRFAVWQSDEH